MAVLPMARIALRNILTRPATRRYPYVKREPFAATRARLTIDFDSCILCGACQKHCPAAAIAVDRGAGLWRIDRLACVSCGACVRACPKKCLALSNERLGAVDAAPPGPAAADASGRSEEHRRAAAAPEGSDA